MKRTVRKIRKRTRRALIGFFSVIGIGLLFVLGFIQSEYFAHLVKDTLDQKLPKSWGIQGDFTDFKVNLFPPGLSIRNPKIQLAKKNIANLPKDSSIEAKRIDLYFFPLQMLTGELRVNETVIVDGKVALELDSRRFYQNRKKQSNSMSMKWNDLFQLKADSLSFVNTKVELNLIREKIKGSFSTRRLSLGMWVGSEGLRFFGDARIEDVNASFPEGLNLPNEMDALELAFEGDASGVLIESIRFSAKGLEGVLKGKINGDILESEDLSYELNGEFQGDIDKFLSLAKSKVNAKGQFEFQGKMRGRFKPFIGSLVADGKLTGQNLVYQNYEVDSLVAQGKWFGPSRELSLIQANLKKSLSERRGSETPASGGEVGIGKFNYSFDRPSPITVPIDFRNAHIHWLTANFVSGTYPLDFRLNGKALVQYVPEIQQDDQDQWQLRVDTDFQLPKFIYDNQRYKRKRKIKNLLRLKDLSLSGPLMINPDGVFLEEMKLTMENTNLTASGKVLFKNGEFDLKIGGPTHLKDFDTLSETKIRGQGRLDVHVRGPGDDFYIDFDSSIKNAEYLNLNFGDFTGLITFSDKNETLKFSRIKSKKNLLHYDAEGLIHIGDRSDVKMDFNIAKGDINDLMGVFDFLVGDLWWFPRSMTGSVNGKLQIRGETDVDRLKISSQLKGRDWDFYGEKFKTIDLDGGYDEGVYYIKKLDARKYRGRINAQVRFDEEQKLIWNLSTQGLKLIDFDHVARLDIPFRGDLEIVSQGQQNKAAIDSLTRLSIGNIQIRGQNFPPSEFEVKSEKDQIIAKGNLNGRQGILSSIYHLKKNEKSFFSLDLREFDFTPLLLVLNPSLISDEQIQGRISGKADLKFKTGSLEFGDGILALDRLFLKKQGVQISSGRPVKFSINKGTFEQSYLDLVSKSGKVTLTAKNKKNKLDGSIVGDLDLGIFEFFTSSIENTKGVIGVDLELDGKLLEPQVTGRGQFEGLAFSNPSLESPLENVTGQFQVKQNEVFINEMSATMSGGSVDANGTISFFPYRYPEIDLDLKLGKNRVKVFPLKYLVASGNLSVKGKERPYLVSGSLAIDDGLITEPVLGQKKLQSQSARFMPPPVTLESQYQPFFRFEIQAVTTKALTLKNDLFDAKVMGNILLAGTVENPKLKGQIQVDSGAAIFKNNRFAIRSGIVEFDNPNQLDPKFNLQANAEVKEYKVNLSAFGRMSEWKIDLSSDPALPQSEIVSLLALGYTSEDLENLGSEDRTVIQQGEAASLLLHSLDFNREVENKTGFQIQVGEAVDTQSGRSIFRPQADTENPAAAPKIVIKRQVVKDVDISVGSTVGVGTSSQREVSAEVRIAPGISVIGVWNTFEGIENQDEQTSYGVDLKFQKRFK